MNQIFAKVLNDLGFMTKEQVEGRAADQMTTLTTLLQIAGVNLKVETTKAKGLLTARIQETKDQAQAELAIAKASAAAAQKKHDDAELFITGRPVPV